MYAADAAALSATSALCAELRLTRAASAKTDQHCYSSLQRTLAMTEWLGAVAAAALRANR